MRKIKLDPRLQSVADLVRPGSFLLDIGTDHAYLPAYLVQNKICRGALACDVRPGPIKNAKETIFSCGLDEEISTRLCDGLDGIQIEDFSDIALAGMGGILISEILSKAEQTKNSTVRIIAQPMTHAEVLREFFLINGYNIIDEKASFDGKRSYCSIAAQYSGIASEFSPSFPFFGKLINDTDTAAVAYVQKQLRRLIKRYNALSSASQTGDECVKIKAVIDDYYRQKGE